MKASHEGFSPVFDPAVYKPFCEQARKRGITDAETLRQSCVCSFLLNEDKEKARKESRAKIDRYYQALVRKAATFPHRRMTQDQYSNYFSPARLHSGWEYGAIDEAFEGYIIDGRTDAHGRAEKQT